MDFWISKWISGFLDERIFNAGRLDSLTCRESLARETRIITAQRMNGYINDNDKVGGDVTNLAERTTGEPEPPISSTQTLRSAAMSARRVDRLSSPIAQGS